MKQKTLDLCSRWMVELSERGVFCVCQESKGLCSKPLMLSDCGTKCVCRRNYEPLKALKADTCARPSDAAARMFVIFSWFIKGLYIFSQTEASQERWAVCGSEMQVPSLPPVPHPSPGALSHISEDLSANWANLFHNFGSPADNANHEAIVTASSWVSSQIIRRVFAPAAGACTAGGKAQGWSIDTSLYLTEWQG